MHRHLSVLFLGLFACATPDTSSTDAFVKAVAPALERFTATPTTVVAGLPIAVEWVWSYSNLPTPTPTCTIDHGVGVVMPGATTTVTIAATTTFTLTCTNKAGSSQASIVIATVPRQVRFSEAFSTNQGGNGFYYRQFDGTYSDMTWDAVNGRWQGTTTYCLIGNGWLHPDGPEAALGWRAPVSGTVTIQGFVERPDARGEGVRVRIVKNGAQLWPSTSDQVIAPRFMVQHVVVTDVTAGDMIYFHVDQQADYGYDTTFWDPVITYASPPKFTTDGAELVITPADMDNMHMLFMDSSLSTVYEDDAENLWFHSWADTTQRFAGPLAAPATAFISETTNSAFANPSGADGVWWINNVYQHSDGSLLAFMHVERAGADQTRWRVGLAYSNDLGRSWTYLGHIISMSGDPSDLNITGVPYLIVNGYFYIYYSEHGAAAVARAPVADVITAAKLGATSPWYKYRNGTWLEPGLGGAASALDVENWFLHSDAAYSTTKNIYVLTGYNHNPGRGVWIAFSTDGVSWTKGDWISRGRDDNKTLSPYITIVNADARDNAVVGDSFYVYWAFAPRWDDPVCAPNAPNCGLRYVYRQRVTLVAP